MGPIAPVAWTPDSSTIVVIERVRKDLEKAGWQISYDERQRAVFLEP